MGSRKVNLGYHSMKWTEPFEKIAAHLAVGPTKADPDVFEHLFHSIESIVRWSHHADQVGYLIKVCRLIASDAGIVRRPLDQV